MPVVTKISGGQLGSLGEIGFDVELDGRETVALILPMEAAATIVEAVLLLSEQSAADPRTPATQHPTSESLGPFVCSGLGLRQMESDPSSVGLIVQFPRFSAVLQMPNQQMEAIGRD